MKWNRTPMVTLDVRFTCEVCKIEIMHKIRVGPHFFLGSDSIPDGWVLEVGEVYLKAWCSAHANQKGI